MHLLEIEVEGKQKALKGSGLLTLCARAGRRENRLIYPKTVATISRLLYYTETRQNSCVRCKG